MDRPRLATLLCIALCGTGALRAQQFSDRPDPNLAREAARAVGLSLPSANQGPTSVRDQSTVRQGGGVSTPNTARPEGPLGNLTISRDTDPNLYNAYKQYLLAYLDGERRKIDDQRAIVMSTNRMGTWVFIVVHLFLALAMGIALEEIWQANRTRRLKRTQEEIELSFQKIALKTSMHGTVLLVLALVLYFLFLKFVYTIVPV